MKPKLKKICVVIRELKQKTDSGWMSFCDDHSTLASVVDREVLELSVVCVDGFHLMRFFRRDNFSLKRHIMNLNFRMFKANKKNERTRPRNEDIPR
ncbi:unnamed protein product [Caenorhabditis nigoni]